MKESIKVFVQHPDGKEDEVEIPLGVSLSLMEVLKGEGYPIEATCGGMALCATCRVEVLNNDEIGLDEAGNDELCMLDTLPCNTGNCRLTCQIHVNEQIDGLKVKFPQEVFAF
jgi:2Fe-2S ferredoxin